MSLPTTDYNPPQIANTTLSLPRTTIPNAPSTTSNTSTTPNATTPLLHAM